MIRAVTIRKFKRFEEETFDVSGHVILAGPNNCGKTTVLQAIAAWALGFKRWKELNDFQRHGGAYTKAPIARQAFSAVPVRAFDLIWKDRTYTGMVEIGLQLADGRRMTMEFHRDSTEQIYVRPKNDIEPAVVRNLALDVVYVAAVGGLSFEEPVYQPDYIQTLLGRQRPGDVVRNLLSQAAQGARWDRLQEAVKRLFGVELLVPESVGGQIISEYQPTGGGARLDILSAGSGFQQVVLLLACLFTRSGSVVLVDEPDAHLHVFLQDTIFAELHRAAAETNSQLVIASHSEVIFNSAAPEQICVMMGKPRRLASGMSWSGSRAQLRSSNNLTSSQPWNHRASSTLKATQTSTCSGNGHACSAIPSATISTGSRSGGDATSSPGWGRGSAAQGAFRGAEARESGDHRHLAGGCGRESARGAGV